MRAWILALSVVALAGCGDEDGSVSLNTGSDAGTGGIDGSMNGRDMGTAPDMAEALDMAQAPDMTVVVDAALPDMATPDMEPPRTWACLEAAVGPRPDATSTPLGLGVDGTIRGAKLLDLGVEDGANAFGLVFVRDDAGGMPRVYFSKFSGTPGCTWSAPALVSDTDTIVDLDARGLAWRALDAAYDATTNTVSVVYTASEAGVVTVVVRTRVLDAPGLDWRRRGLVVDEPVGADAPALPALAVHDGTTYVAYTQRFGNCVTAPGDGVEECRRLVVGRVTADGATSVRVAELPLLTVPELAAETPALAFDDRGALGVAAFVRLDRHADTDDDPGTTLAQGKLALYRIDPDAAAEVGAWEFVAFGSGLLAGDSHAAVSLAFHGGRFWAAATGRFDVPDWLPTPGPTQGLFVFARARHTQAGYAGWTFEHVALGDGADVFGDSLRLLIDANGYRSVVVGRAVVSGADASGVGPVIVRFERGATVPRTGWVLDRSEAVGMGFSADDFAGRAVDAVLLPNGKVYAFVVAPESGTDGAPDGAWVLRDSPTDTAAPPACEVGLGNQFVSEAPTSPDNVFPLLWTRLLVDTANRPILVYAERLSEFVTDPFDPTNTLEVGRVSLKARRFERHEPLAESCWWSEPFELTSVVEWTPDVPVSEELIDAAYDLDRDAVVVAVRAASPDRLAEPTLRVAGGRFDSAYPARPGDVALDPAVFSEASALRSLTLHVNAGDAFVAVTRGLSCEAIGGFCVEPSLLTFPLDDLRRVEHTAIPLVYGGNAYSILAGAPLSVRMDGDVLSLAWIESRLYGDPLRVAGRVVVAKRDAATGEFERYEVFAYDGDTSPALRGGSPVLSHVLDGDQYVVATNYAPDAVPDSPQYVLFAFDASGAMAPTVRTVSLPNVTRVEIVSGADLSVVGQLSTTWMEDALRVGPVTAVFDAGAGGAFSLVRAGSLSEMLPNPVGGEAFDALDDAFAGALTSYVARTPLGSDSPAGVYLWRRR